MQQLMPEISITLSRNDCREVAHLANRRISPRRKGRRIGRMTDGQIRLGGDQGGDRQHTFTYSSDSTILNIV
jgi:hypothetical protein